MDEADIKKSIGDYKKLGLSRVFIISGESGPRYSAKLCRIIEHAKLLDLEVNAAAGVFSKSEYRDMKKAGLDIYTLKFESSNEKIFRKSKPDISFEKRMAAISWIKEADLKLGSGNIIGLEDQSVEDLADDIRLMVDLAIDWAPVVPYMPVPGTPMGETTPMGSVELTLRTLALLRIYLPDVRITAGQPTQNSTLGFSDPEGTRNALSHGADLLFVETTPKEVSEQFEVVSSRKLARLDELRTLTSMMDLRLQ
jgi:biotin synthase